MKYFPGRKAYDDFYDILVGIGDIGVITIANRAQNHRGRRVQREGGLVQGRLHDRDQASQGTGCGATRHGLAGACEPARVGRSDFQVPV